jgi:hypothetical protein
VSAHYPAGCSQDDADRSSNGDAEYVDELDEFQVLDCGHSGTIRNAEETGGRLVCEECFLHPPQLPRLSARQRPMKAVEEPVCQHSPCDNHAAYCCDQCDTYFCSDHGTPGGDRDTQDVGMVAVPSLCWKCGGFNVDEEFPETKKAYIASLIGGLEELAR